MLGLKTCATIPSSHAQSWVLPAFATMILKVNIRSRHPATSDMQVLPRPLQYSSTVWMAEVTVPPAYFSNLLWCQSHFGSFPCVAVPVFAAPMPLCTVFLHGVLASSYSLCSLSPNVTASPWHPLASLSVTCSFPMSEHPVLVFVHLFFIHSM